MNEVKLIVIGSKIEDVEKCGKVATKVKKTLAKYAHVEILFVNVPLPSGISLNGEEIVPCDVEDEAMDYIISKIASFSSNMFTKGVAMAAAVLR